MINQIKQSANVGEENEPTGKYGNLEDSSKKVAMTTGKSPINLPVDTTLKALEPKSEMAYGEFMDKNFVFIAASVQMPVEIALMLFQNNFSSSRMAAKMWEQILEIKREEFSNLFYKPFYNIFLELEILKGKIQANGYFNSIVDKDVILLQAYQNSRFIGSKVPHVDPLKEVNAEKAKVEAGFQTNEKATENLNGGDYAANQDKLREEDRIKFKREDTTTNTQGAD